ncbi:MAG: hypothetical protein ACKVP3_23070 [Hyphomicrobiaceae bacterium]
MQYLWIVVALFCALISTSATSGELFLNTTPWRDIPLLRRLQVLSSDALSPTLKGPIRSGDFAEIQKIHAVVPIEQLRIRSPGGSVAEALKIAEFVNHHFIEVVADNECGTLQTIAECGCTSSCALIWLAAPIRSGGVVRVHRPYFDTAEFPNLPDTQAMHVYNAALDGVRNLLTKQGYSAEFLAKMLRMRREEVRLLTRQEISELPINTALDELISARCFAPHEKVIKERTALQEAIARVQKSIDSADMPRDVAGYILEKDPRYSATWKQWHNDQRKLSELQVALSKNGIEYVKYEFCRIRQQKQVSLATSTGHLTEIQRKRIEQIVRLIIGAGKSDAIRLTDQVFAMPSVNDAADVTSLRTKILPLWDEVRASLPQQHAEFIRTAPR